MRVEEERMNHQVRMKSEEGKERIEKEGKTRGIYKNQEWMDGKPQKKSYPSLIQSASMSTST